MRLREEKVSGTSRQGREELKTLLEFLRDGDTLVVTRLDRLARSMDDLSGIARELQEKGVALKATEQPVDTSSAAGKAFFQMLGVLPNVPKRNSPRIYPQMAGCDVALIVSAVIPVSRDVSGDRST